MNNTIKLQKRHCSIREFTKKKIDTHLLYEIIKSAQSASSSNFIQAYSIIQINDSSMRDIISEVSGGQNWVKTAAEFFIICADLTRIKYANKKNGLSISDGYTEHFITATIDTALMGQNFLLAAESVGLGGVFIGGIRNDPMKISELLNMPENIYPLFGLCLGWPVTYPDVKPRFSIDTILHKEKFDASRIEENVDEYDEFMKVYYQNRSDNPKITNWSQEVSTNMSNKKRPYMLKFLNNKGFLKK